MFTTRYEPGSKHKGRKTIWKQSNPGIKKVNTACDSVYDKLKIFLPILSQKNTTHNYRDWKVSDLCVIFSWLTFSGYLYVYETVNAAHAFNACFSVTHSSVIDLFEYERLYKYLLLGKIQTQKPCTRLLRKIFSTNSVLELFTNGTLKSL